jgi:hypothetical protein
MVFNLGGSSSASLMHEKKADLVGNYVSPLAAVYWTLKCATCRRSGVQKSLRGQDRLRLRTSAVGCENFSQKPQIESLKTYHSYEIYAHEVHTSEMYAR